MLRIVLDKPCKSRSGCGGYRKTPNLAMSSVAAAWMVTAERSCPCKQPACPAIGGGSVVTFKQLVPRSCTH
ncbi:hypothetical protein J6590_046773 [Homalodisca vitripennis]|nr:hypothetical protein J6590_046773 [Homalodisca vitripennis]